MAKVNYSAQAAGFSMDTLIGVLTTGQEVSQQEPELVGNAWRTIFARIQNVKAGKFASSVDEIEASGTMTSEELDGMTDEDFTALNDVEKVLNALNIQTRVSANTWVNAEDLMNEIAEKWENWSDVTKSAVANAMAGTRQREQFMVVMNNWDSVKNYSDMASSSMGAAAQKMEAYTDSLTAAQTRIQTAWEGLTLDLPFQEVLTEFYETLATLINNLKTVLPVAAFGGLSLFISSLIKNGGSLVAMMPRTAAALSRNVKFLDANALSEKAKAAANKESTASEKEKALANKEGAAAKKTDNAATQEEVNAKTEDAIETQADATAKTRDYTSSNYHTDSQNADTIANKNHTNSEQEETIANRQSAESEREEIIANEQSAASESQKAALQTGQAVAGAVKMAGTMVNGVLGSRWGAALGKRWSSDEEEGEAIGTTVGSMVGMASTTVLSQVGSKIGGMIGPWGAIIGTIAGTLTAILGNLVAYKSIYLKDKEKEEKIEQAQNDYIELSEQYESYSSSEVNKALSTIEKYKYGVSSIGSNLSLTEDEYADFVDANATLAETFPELVQNYLGDDVFVKFNGTIDESTGKVVTLSDIISEKLDELQDKANELFFSDEIMGQSLQEFNEAYHNSQLEDTKKMYSLLEEQQNIGEENDYTKIGARLYTAADIQALADSDEIELGEQTAAQYANYINGVVTTYLSDGKYALDENGNLVSDKITQYSADALQQNTEALEALEKQGFYLGINTDYTDSKYFGTGSSFDYDTLGGWNFIAPAENLSLESDAAYKASQETRNNEMKATFTSDIFPYLQARLEQLDSYTQLDEEVQAALQEGLMDNWEEFTGATTADEAFEIMEKYLDAVTDEENKDTFTEILELIDKAQTAETYEEQTAIAEQILEKTKELKSDSGEILKRMLEEPEKDVGVDPYESTVFTVATRQFQKVGFSSEEYDEAKAQHDNLKTAAANAEGEYNDALTEYEKKYNTDQEPLGIIDFFVDPSKVISSFINSVTQEDYSEEEQKEAWQKVEEKKQQWLEASSALGQNEGIISSYIYNNTDNTEIDTNVASPKVQEQQAKVANVQAQITEKENELAAVYSKPSTGSSQKAEQLNSEIDTLNNQLSTEYGRLRIMGGTQTYSNYRTIAGANGGTVVAATNSAGGVNYVYTDKYGNKQYGTGESYDEIWSNGQISNTEDSWRYYITPEEVAASTQGMLSGQATHYAEYVQSGLYTNEQALEMSEADFLADELTLNGDNVDNLLNKQVRLTQFLTGSNKGDRGTADYQSLLKEAQGENWDEDTVNQKVAEKFGYLTKDAREALVDGVEEATEDSDSDLTQIQQDVTKEVGTYLTETANAIQAIDINKYFTDWDENANNLVDSFSELKSILDQLSESYEHLSDAMEEQNENGKLSWQTTLELLSENSNYAAALEVVDGKVRLKANAEEILAQAQMQAAYAAVKQMEEQQREGIIADFAAIGVDTYQESTLNSTDASLENVSALDAESTAYLRQAEAAKAAAYAKEAAYYSGLADAALDAGNEEDAHTYHHEAQLYAGRVDTTSAYTVNPVTTDTSGIDTSAIRTSSKQSKIDAAKDLAYQLGWSEETLSQVIDLDTGEVNEGMAQVFFNNFLEQDLDPSYYNDQDSPYWNIHKLLDAMGDDLNAGDWSDFYDNYHTPDSSSSEDAKTDLEKLKDLLDSVNKEFEQMLALSNSANKSMDETFEYMNEHYYGVQKTYLQRMLKELQGKLGLNNEDLSSILTMDEDKIRASIYTMDDDDFDDYIGYLKDLESYYVQLNNLDDEQIQDKIDVYEKLVDINDETIKLYEEQLKTADTYEEQVEYMTALNEKLLEQIDNEREIYSWEKKILDYRLQYESGNPLQNGTISGSYSSLMAEEMNVLKQDKEKAVERVNQAYQNAYNEALKAGQSAEIAETTAKRDKEYRSAIESYYEAYQAIGNLIIQEFEDKFNKLETYISRLETSKPNEWASSWNASTTKVTDSAISKIKSYYTELISYYQQEADAAYKTLTESAGDLTDEQVQDLVDKYNSAVKTVRDNTEEMYSSIKTYQESVYSALTSEVNDYIDQINTQKEIIEDMYNMEIDKLTEKNESIERTNKLLELQKALQTATDEKERVYRQGE